MGTSSINGPFSMAMLNNQRVLEFISCRCNPQFRDSSHVPFVWPKHRWTSLLFHSHGAHKVVPTMKDCRTMNNPIPPILDTA